MLADTRTSLQMAADLSLIPAPIEERVRSSRRPPSNRATSPDVEQYGQTVPAGSAMVLLNALANRDERDFDDPDRFDILCKAQRHSSFGYGLYFRLGAHLARLEACVALEEVLSGSRSGKSTRSTPRRRGPRRCQAGELLVLVP